MNFNTSIYNNGAHGMAQEFGVSDQAAKVGSAIFLIMYAFGCELWAPWSEEFGRKPVLQASMTLVNLFQLPVALAPNLGAVTAGRALGGLSTAGGSVTLGMVADLWEPENQQYAVAYVVFSSVGGSILGPIFGGFLEAYADWRFVLPLFAFKLSLTSADGASGSNLSWVALSSSSIFLQSPRPVQLSS